MAEARRPFNHCRPEYAAASIQRAMDRGELTQRDADLLHEFIQETRVTNGIGISRGNKLIFSLVSWRRYIGPFADNSTAELYKAFIDIDEAKSLRGKPYKKNTLVDLKKILKQFYLWMSENGYTAIPLLKIQRLKTDSRDTTTKTAGELLTPEEVEMMINACKRDMDRALLVTLYEGAFRIGELGAMTWRQVHFDKDGVVVNLKFKTDKERYVRLFMATEHLSRWRASYPGTPEGDALVFVGKDGQPLNHGAVLVQMRRIAARAGLTKHITPHLWRHSRITHLVKEGMNESVIKMIGWGSVDTRMFKTYLHLAGKDIDAETKRFYGIGDTEEMKEKRLEPIQCPHCRNINGPTSRYCSICGRSLTVEATEDADEATDRLRLMPEWKARQAELEELQKRVRELEKAMGKRET
jgi:integrase/recombinase XerD